jgi:formyl-CoA transferase
MAVPLMQHEGGAPPRRMGLAHTSIAPYGVFKTADGADILISIQSDREWRVLAEQVLGDKALANDPNFASNVERVRRRAETDRRGLQPLPVGELLSRGPGDASQQVPSVRLGVR